MDRAWLIGGGLQQYVGADYDLELRRTFRTRAETVSRITMAEALAAAFRASDSGFASLFACLFEYSHDEQRGKMLTVLIPCLTPSAQEALRHAGLFGYSVSGPDVVIERMSDLSLEAVQLIAAEAERSDASVVERVCDLCSRFPNTTKYLPAETLASVLANLAQRAERSAPGTSL
jgi:hypothetical protein